MIVPYNVDVPMQRLPWANWELIAFICVVSLFVFFDDHRRYDRKSIQEVDQLRELVFESQDPRERSRAFSDYMQKSVELPPAGPAGHPLALQPKWFHWWQLITCQFVHIGFWHLFGNMLFLFCFGNAVNAKLGHALYLLVYLLLGTIPSIVLWLVMTLTGDVRPALGASGAIMAIVGMYIVFYPKNNVAVFYWFFRYAGTAHVSGFWIILYFVFWDLFYLVLSGGVLLGCLAHLVGFVIGAILAVFLLKTGIIKTDSEEENLLQALGLMPKPQRINHSRLGDEP